MELMRNAMTEDYASYLDEHIHHRDKLYNLISRLESAAQQLRKELQKLERTRLNKLLEEGSISVRDFLENGP